MRRTFVFAAAALTACCPPETGSAAGGGGASSTASTTTSITTTAHCAPGLAFDPSSSPAHHLGGAHSAFPSGTLLAARFDPFTTPTLAAPTVYLRVSEQDGCALPDEILSGAWTETDGPTVDPFITQSLLSPDMVKPTADPETFRVRLDPVSYPGNEDFPEAAYSAVLLVPGLCPVLYSPSCDPSNGFLHTINGWSSLSTLADASPGLGLYTDP